MYNNTLSSPQNTSWKTRTIIARIVLFSAFVILTSYFVFLTLFPLQTLSFDFKNPKSSKNTLLSPHATDGLSLEKGNVSNEELIVDASVLSGDYALLKTSIAPDKKSAAANGSVRIQKSFRAFFLPLGEPVLQEASFTDRFQSGSLVSFAGGVFLIDGSLVRPIGDAFIFENLGYDWSDVMPGNEEDLSLFERGKMVTIGNQHPDGTVFYTIDTHRYFLIDNALRREIPDERIAKTYLKEKHPVLVSETSLHEHRSCSLHPSGFFRTRFECQTALDKLEKLPGDSYRIEVSFENNNISLQNMNVTFSNVVNKNNMLVSLSRIKQRIFSHYGYEQ